jgi:hypothetical protein
LSRVKLESSGLVGRALLIKELSKDPDLEVCLVFRLLIVEVIREIYLPDVIPLLRLLLMVWPLQPTHLMVTPDAENKVHTARGGTNNMKFEPPYINNLNKLGTYHIFQNPD